MASEYEMITYWSEDAETFLVEVPEKGRLKYA